MTRDIGAVIFDQEHASLFFAEYEGNEGKVPSKDFKEILVKCDAENPPTPTSDEGKHTFAVWLASGMEGSQSYELQMNLDPKTGEIPEGISTWRCLYRHIAANTVFVSILGYGDTPQEAMHDCEDVREFIQFKYNLKGEIV